MSSISDLIFKIYWKNTIDRQTYTNDDWKRDVIGGIMTILILLIFIGICALPETFTEKNKFNKNQ